MFDETLFYDPDLPQPQDIPTNLSPQMIETIQLPPAIQKADTEPDPEPTFDDLYEGNRETHPSILHTKSYTESIAHTESNEDSSEPKQQITDHAPLSITSDQTSLSDSSSQKKSTKQRPGAFAESAPHTPQQDSTMDPFFILSPSNRTLPNDDEDPDPAAHQLSTELEEYNPAPHCSSGLSFTAGDEEIEPSQPNQRQNIAQQSTEISADLDPGLIITEKCKRKQITHDVFAMCQHFSLGWERTSKLPSPWDSSLDFIPDS